jgi:DNA replication ATP-dependent helicase Dna2
MPPQFDFGPLPTGAEASSGDDSSQQKGNARLSSSSNVQLSPGKSKRSKGEVRTPVKTYGYLESKQHRNQELSSAGDEASVKWQSSSPVRPEEDCLDCLPRDESAINTFADSIPISDPTTDLDNKFKSLSRSNSDLKHTKKRAAGTRLFKASNPEKARHLFSPGYRRSYSAEAYRPAAGRQGLGDLLVDSNANRSRSETQPKRHDDPFKIQVEDDSGDDVDLAKALAATPSSPPIREEDLGIDNKENIDPLEDGDDDDDDDDDFDMTVLNEQIKRREASQLLTAVRTVDPKSETDSSEFDETELVNYLQSKTYTDVKKEDVEPIGGRDKTPRKLEDFDSDSDSDMDIDAAVGKLIEERDKENNSRADFKNAKSVRTRQDSPERPSFKCVVNKPNLHRYVVMTVEEDTYSPEKFPNLVRDQLVLTVMDTTTVRKTVYLRDEWLAVTPETGDVIQVIGDYDPSETTIVVEKDSQNLFVLHPDFLVNCTHIAESFYCQRKVVIRDRMRSAADLPNKAMFYGDVIHLLFQTCLAEGDFSDKFMKTTLRRLVETQFFETLLLIGLKLKDTLEELEDRLPQLQRWNSIYFRYEPLQTSTVFEHRNPNSMALVSASKVIAIEEEVWSPLFGLKGKIDVTMQTTLRDGVIRGNYLVPLEIKTSTNTRSMAHRAQTTLYSLLLSDRYDIPIKHGLLVYSHAGEVVRIPNFQDEIRNLLSRRNEVAVYYKNNTTYPEMVRAPEKCRTCNRRDVCMLFHKIIEDGTEESSGVDEIFTYETEHVTDTHKAFFKHWNDLLDKEGQNMNRHLKEIWTMTSQEREQVGRCFGELIIKPTDGGAKQASNGRYTYQLTRTDTNDRINYNYNDSHLSSGDLIIISDESGKVCLSRGILRNVNRFEIEVETYSAIEFVATRLPGFQKDENQLFKSVVPGKNEKVASQTLKFRIDKDEFGHAMALARNNLAQLFTRDNGDQSTRELVVEKRAPQFDVSKKMEYSDEVKKFNSDQQRAIDMAMMAEDYTLILGMPGTGKTTTIAALIRSIVAQNKTVLIASYTHSAVDNILIKIKDSGFKITRIGSKGRVHPEVAHMVPNVDISLDGDLEDLEHKVKSAYYDPPVVATTCLAINNWIFTKRKFDYCIIDEASQVTLPTCIGPLRYADKFILVGDHYQLSPLVKSADALSGGLDLSLFRYLCETHPSAVVNLAHQYRMCEDIMFLSNNLIYDGQLKCGTKEVAQQVLRIPDKPNLSRFIAEVHPDNDWLGYVMKEE